MEKFVVLEKNRGETPLQALERFRAGRPDLRDVAMTYAGRLDPMAEGRLLILLGEECKNKEKYLGLDKEYEFEVLFGVATDSGDILGMPTWNESAREVTETEAGSAARGFIGKHELPYPAFSSKAVAGKQLFRHARAGSLEKTGNPKRIMEVKEMEFLGMKRLGKKELLEDVLARIAEFRPPESGLEGSDFRKDEISERWRKSAEGFAPELRIARFRAKTGAGTYIRTIAPLIAEACGSSGLAYSIKRTNIFLPHAG